MAPMMARSAQDRSPHPRTRTGSTPSRFVVSRNGLPAWPARACFGEECDQPCLGGHLKEGRIFEAGDDSDGDVPADDYRNSRVTFIKPSAESKWLFDKLGGIVAQPTKSIIRWSFWLFEPLQIAAYGPGQKYDWHLDIGNGKVSIRKLSIVIQLSDPADYEGGSLTTMSSKELFEFPKTRGTVIVFP